MKPKRPAPHRSLFASIRAIRGLSSVFPPFAFRAPGSSSGSALILTLLITALLATIAVSFLSTSRVEQIASRNFSRQNAAIGLAELATQQAMAQIQKGFTTSGNATTVITSQPGAIRQFVFSNGSIDTTASNLTELFSGGINSNATTNGTANLNNLRNPNSNTTLTSNASNNQWTITGNATEQISVPMEEVTITENSTTRVVGRIAYYVDDEGTKLNANSAIGNRTSLNAAARPQDIGALLSSNQYLNFNNIVNGLGSNATTDEDKRKDIKNWASFFRPEQVRAAVSGSSSSDIPFITTATSSANTTANMTHLLTPWGTQRLYINELSTNATDGSGDASVSTIHSTLTNSTLTAIYGSDFATKYTDIGVKQIAANMLQMRDPNTATVNASFSYQGPLIGSRSLSAYNSTPQEASASIPQEYLGYAPYPVISEVSADVGYITTGKKPKEGVYSMIYIMINVELYNPYPIAFNAPNATLEYCIRGLTFNMTHSVNSTGQTYGPYRYGGYGNWTDSTSSKEWARNFSLRNNGYSNTQFREDNSLRDNPYGIKGIYIPAYSKTKYNLVNYGWFSGVMFRPESAFPFDANDIRIESITDVRCTITYIKITANSTIALKLGGNHNINPNSIRDWVTGADVGPFIPNNGNLSMAGGGSGSLNYLDQGAYKWPPPPAGTPISFPRKAGLADFLTPVNPISDYSYQRLCPLIKTSMAAAANLTDSTRSWTINASTANQTFGNRTFSDNPTRTANQTEQLNHSNANPFYDAGNTIPSDPSLSNYNGNAIYSNATLSNGTIITGNNTSDMRIPELPNFSGNYRYTSPSDLGLVPTNQRWRRLRMQMQPSAEGSLIPDWAMLDIISFGNSTNPNNAFSRMLPVNINGMFHLPGNATIAPRTKGVEALAQVISYSGNGSIQDPTNPTSTAIALSSNETQRFKGNTANATTIANAIGNMTWSIDSAWGNATTGKRWKINNITPINNYILPSEIMEIEGVADAVSQTSYSNNSTHFKWNEGRASALIPAVTTRSSCFMVYAYAQALDKTGNIESEALTKTMVEVLYNAGNYTVKKLYTQPIPLGQ